MLQRSTRSCFLLRSRARSFAPVNEGVFDHSDHHRFSNFEGPKNPNEIIPTPGMGSFQNVSYAPRKDYRYLDEVTANFHFAPYMYFEMWFQHFREVMDLTMNHFWTIPIGIVAFALFEGIYRERKNYRERTGMINETSETDRTFNRVFPRKAYKDFSTSEREYGGQAQTMQAPEDAWVPAKMFHRQATEKLFMTRVEDYNPGTSLIRGGAGTKAERRPSNFMRKLSKTGVTHVQP